MRFRSPPPKYKCRCVVAMSRHGPTVDGSCSTRAVGISCRRLGAGTTFVTGERRVLFSTQGFRSATPHQEYDVTPDDQRFVMIRNLGGQDAGELIVVENFFEELKAKVGN